MRRGQPARTRERPTRERQAPSSQASVIVHPSDFTGPVDGTVEESPTGVADSGDLSSLPLETPTPPGRGRINSCLAREPNTLTRPRAIQGRQPAPRSQVTVASPVPRAS
jgi:hypothetical protein